MKHLLRRMLLGFRRSEDCVGVSGHASLALADRRGRLSLSDSGPGPGVNLARAANCRAVLFRLMQGCDFFQDAMHA